MVELVDPVCAGMVELPSASEERAKVAKILQRMRIAEETLVDACSLSPSDPLFIHLSNRMAYTTGSALGCIPPSNDECLEAYQIPNKMGLTAGSRAWSKHSHRSFASPPPDPAGVGSEATLEVEVEVDAESVDRQKKSSRAKAKADELEGWWGRPSGPVSTINDKSLAIFWRVMNNVTWRNLHWLPHEVLVYEVRVREGYGMRWAQDKSGGVLDRPWLFRGFLEPQMPGGHDVGWRHPISSSVTVRV